MFSVRIFCIGDVPLTDNIGQIYRIIAVVHRGNGSNVSFCHDRERQKISPHEMADIYPVCDRHMVALHKE